MATALAIMIGLCLLLLLTTTLFFCFWQMELKNNKRYHTPVNLPEIDWDYTREMGWREDREDGSHS